MKSQKQMTSVRWAVRGLIIAAAGLPVTAWAGYIGTQDPTLLWHMDGAGLNPVATDATSNHFNGTSVGGVTVDAVGVTGTAFNGFASTGTRTTYDFVDQGFFQVRNFSFVAWVKNPNLATNSVDLIARAAVGQDGGASADNAWTLWVDGNTGKLKLGLQSWVGSIETFASTVTPTWTSDQWYQVAFTLASGWADGNYLETTELYVTPQGASEVVNVGSHIFSRDSGLSRSSVLVVGGAPNGWYSDVAPGGNFGGSIDEVSLWMDKTLSTAELNQTLAAVPEPATIVSVAGLAGTLLLRRSKKN